MIGPYLNLVSGFPSREVGIQCASHDWLGGYKLLGILKSDSSTEGGAMLGKESDKATVQRDPDQWTRRSVLGLGSLFLLSACSKGQGAPNDDFKADVGSYFGQSPFYIAHRGSGDNWTEHSMQAYSGADSAGAGALEVSVNATSDGHLICHHDRDLARLTGSPGLVSETTLAEIMQMRLDASQWLGPSAPHQPFVELSTVLEEFADRRIIFLEDKQGTNTEQMLQMMKTHDPSKQHIVWKQPAIAKQVDAVSAEGYKTWGYFMPGEAKNFEALVPKFDFVGLHHSAPDDLFKRLVAMGKPVICWEVHTRWMRDRLTGLGVSGMMCSNYPYVSSAKAHERRDQFTTGLRGPGDLPWTVDRGWGVQPVINPAAGSIRITEKSISSYIMGSMSPIDRDSYSLRSSLRWPMELPDRNLHAGLAFGQDSDRPYRVLTLTEVGGYHVAVRPSGEITLDRRDPGDTEGTRLKKLDTEAIASGQWIDLQIDVGPAGIRISRNDSTGWSTQVDDSRHRGGYISLCKNYSDPVPVEFKDVSVT